MNRLRLLAPLTALLGLGVLAGGFAEWLPESLRAIVALGTLLVAPAVFLVRIIPVRDRRSQLLRLSLSFLSWLSLLSIWTAVFTMAGASFRVYAMATTWLLMAAYTAAALASVRRRGEHSEVRIPSRAVLALVAGCMLLAAWMPHHLGIEADGLDHVGYIRRILTGNDLRPAGVLAVPVGQPEIASDPRKGTVHDIVAVAAWVSDTDPLVVWRWLPVLMFPVAMCAAISFNMAFLRTRAAMVTAAALVLLTFDRNLFRFADASPHGETLAATFAWALTAAVLAGIWRRSRAWPWLWVAAGGVLIHLGVAMHLAVLAMTVALAGGMWGIGRGDRLRLAATILAGVVLGLAGRQGDVGGVANIIHAHTQGVLFVSGHWFVASPFEMLRQQGLVYLGGLVCVPLLLPLIRHRDDARAVVAAAAVPFAIAFIPWVATFLYQRGSYMVFRALLQVPAMAAIAVCASVIATGIRERHRGVLLAGVPAAILWLIVFVRPVPRALVTDVRLRFHEARTDRAPAVAPALIDAVAALPAGSVVLSDPATSYVLSAYTSQRFVVTYQQHGNPRDPFVLDRMQAARDVLSPYVLPATAVEDCRRYGVNYVVVNGDSPYDASRFLSVWRPSAYPVALRRMRSMGDSFARIDSVAGACMYRFEPAASVDRAWEAQDQPVVVAAPPLNACPLDAPNGAFQVTGLGIDPASVLPGDIVHVTVGYRCDAPVGYRMPVLMHLRFDHQDLVSGREFPGEKQWRRARARRSGQRERFRVDVYPGHGFYDPDLWPTGVALCETFDVVVPVNARPGKYNIEMSLVQDALIPNFHIRDLLFNRDHYSGTTCGSVEIVDHTGASPE